MDFNSNNKDVKERDCTKEEWKAKAEALWTLLDDIDTASDIFKPTHSNFYKYIMGKTDERFKHLSSDGYKLYVAK